MPPAGRRPSPLHAAHRDRQRVLSRAVGARLARELAALPDLSPDAEQRYTAAAVRHLTAGQRTAAALAAGYVHALAPTRVAAIAPELELGEVAARADRPWIAAPVVRARARLAEGFAWPDAIASAGRYAGSLASVDLQRAVELGLERGAAAARVRIIGWAKELDGDACDWCHLVADRLYASPDSVPMHDHDRCSASPVFDEGE